VIARKGLAMKSTASRIALFALLAFATPALAQTKFSDDVVFTFTPDAGTKDVVDDLKDITNNNSNISLRPNGAGEFHLYVKNPARGQKTYTVELTTEPKGAIAAKVKVTIPGEKWKRVRFPKPEPVAVLVVIPAAVPAAAPAPKVEVPAGAELTRAKEGFRFVLRLLDDTGEPVLGTDKEELGRVCSVSLLKPSAYLSVTKPTLIVPKEKSESAQIRVPAAAIAGKASGEATVQLSFPPTLNSPTLILREGVYRRAIALDDGATANKSVILLGNVQKIGDAIRAEVSIDGIDRAFIYTSATKGEVKKEDWQKFDERLVRILAPKTVTRPTTAFPIKLEADNAPDGANLEVQIKQVGAENIDANKEIVQLKGSRQERVWVELAGKTDGGFAIANRSTDWIVALDLGERRGKLEVVAVLKGSDGKDIPPQSDAFIVTVDATAPEDVKFLKLPARHIKGTPLPVSAILQDNDTKVVKAVFFLGELQEGGKLPEGPKVPGKQAIDPKTKLATLEWLGLMPLDPMKRGEITIGVAVTDEVGNTTTETQKVELVDPPAALGTIKGKVMLGERAQPGLTVTLADGEGKPKGAAVTDEYGRFQFEKVVPGPYSLKTGKTDTTSGLAGAATIAVVADEPEPAPATYKDKEAEAKALAEKAAKEKAKVVIIVLKRNPQ